MSHAESCSIPRRYAFDSIEVGVGALLEVGRLT